MQFCSSLSILWHCLSWGLEWKLGLSSHGDGGWPGLLAGPLGITMSEEADDGCWQRCSLAPQCGLGHRALAAPRSQPRDPGPLGSLCLSASCCGTCILLSGPQFPQLEKRRIQGSNFLDDVLVFYCYHDGLLHISWLKTTSTFSFNSFMFIGIW